MASQLFQVWKSDKLNKMLQIQEKVRLLCHLKLESKEQTLELQVLTV